MLYLVSYPRSGNHWFRFIIEWFSGRPTLGCKDNGQDQPLCCQPCLHHVLSHVKGEPIAQKCHYFDIPTIDPEKDQVILIIRDYKECLIRHLYGKTEIQKQHYGLILEHLGHYLGLIHWFDNLSCPKRIVYYEDLVDGLGEVIQPILQWLNIYDQEKWNQFSWKRELFKELSIGLYDQIYESITKGNDLTFYQRRVQDPDLWEAIDQHVKGIPAVERYRVGVPS
jgi:hypothetical protein